MLGLKMLVKTSLIEIFRTPQGAVYQCNRRNCYWLEFAGGLSPFRVPDFQRLRRQVEAVNVSEMIQNTHRAADLVILMPLHSERCFVLTLTDVLHFRDLLRGAKAMLELNSILHECLHAMPV